MDRSAALLRVLSDAVRAFTDATTDYRQLLDTIVERVAHVVQHHCAIRLVSPDREFLELVAHYDVDPQARSLGERVMGATRLRVDSPHLTTRVLEMGSVFVVPEVDLDALRSEVMPDIWSAMVELEVKSLLYVPLRVHREVIGVLSIARRGRDSAPLDDTDVELAQALADHAALTISNARLFADARRQHVEKRRAEDSLRMVEDARRFAQAIVDGVREPVLVLDPQLRVRASNGAFQRLYGLSLEQVRDRPLSTLPGWDHAALGTMLADVLPRRAENEVQLEQEIGAFHRRIVVHARALDLPRTDGDAILLSIDDHTSRVGGPPALAAKRATERRDHDQAHLPSIAIVLVDADDQRAEQTTRMLRQHHLRNDVVRARDSLEALEVLFASDTQRARHPERPSRLVLLALEPIDLALEVLRHRLKDPLARAIPVVVLAPRAGHPTIPEVQRLGANAIAIEPLGFDALVRAVHPLGMSWLLLGSPR